MGHLISEPKFKIPTPPSPLLISDKSLSGNNGSTIWTEVALLNWLETKIFSSILENKNLFQILGLTGSEGAYLANASLTGSWNPGS